MTISGNFCFGNFWLLRNLYANPIRHSFDKASNKATIHVVSAWSSQNRLILGQVQLDDKSNEITALPKLLQLLILKGCLVTIDAMGNTLV